MQKDTANQSRLKEAGAADDMIREYQHYLDAGDKQGQKGCYAGFAESKKTD